ncbi:MAG: hypothetical protein KQ78_01815 [Candidatus Izimaplasma bacterium HR2]|nr:MAG: hypothetical protein KQ78_01815 [Candidatus Izimaplasma bacterium HR2]
MKIKRIAFDMDGNIADLYGFSGWLERLQNSKPVFAEIEPMIDMEEVNSLCKQLEEKGYEIMVITWLPMFASEEYKTACRAEKKAWLAKYFPMVKEIHSIQYGSPKHHATKGLKDCLLFDDNEGIRNKWENYGGVAIDEKSIIRTLEKLLEV